MEICCSVCGRVNKIQYANDDKNTESKERIAKCAYCNTEILCVNESRQVYAIEWND